MIQSNQTREPLVDNLKAIAIFFVVLGHLLECFSFSSKHVIYSLIYVFHMPLFVFISGYLCKFGFKKTLTKLVLPLVLFQVIYSCFDALLNNRGISISLVQPYWHLWYLFSLICWKVLFLPLSKIKKTWLKIVVIVLCFILSLSLGFYPNLTRKFSAGRTIFFFPFFVLGYFIKSPNTDLSTLRKNKAFLVINSILCLVGIICICTFDFLPTELLYSASSYRFVNANLWKVFLYRFILYILSLVFVFEFVLLTAKVKVPIFKQVSISSLYIYLFHGFIILLFKRFNILPNGYMGLAYSIIIAYIFVVFVSVIYSLVNRLINKIKA